VDTIMGCLINTLPVRVQADPGAELAPWLQALQRSLVELRQHEHTPLVDVLGWADLPRRTPLFDSLVIVESFTADASFVMSHTGFFQRSHYALTLVSSLDPVVTLRLGYEPGRFPEDLVLRILRDLESLLAAMVEDPAQPLGALVGELAAKPPAEEEPRQPGPRIPPRTDRERAIAEIWREVLGVEEVGVEDDFFDLGGHSLLLLRMADRVRSAAGRELPLADLFACRTVASLARAVEAGLAVDVR
jgi:acyl carrier protein